MIHTCDTYTWFIHVIFCNIIPTSRVDYAVRIDMPKGSSPKKSEGFYVHWPARTCISWDMPHNYGLYNPLVSGTAPPSMAKWWLNVQDWNHQQVARNRSGKAPASRTNLLFFFVFLWNHEPIRLKTSLNAGIITQKKRKTEQLRQQTKHDQSPVAENW